MSIPDCIASTTIIANIGTTPQERGLTADQFKAKFDEGPTNIVEDLNSNILPAIRNDILTGGSKLRSYMGVNFKG